MNTDTNLAAWMIAGGHPSPRDPTDATGCPTASPSRQPAEDRPIGSRPDRRPARSARRAPRPSRPAARPDPAATGTHSTRRTSDDARPAAIHDEVRASTPRPRAPPPSARRARGRRPSCCAPTGRRLGRTSSTRPTTAPRARRAVLASLGCGNPTAVAELREGERVSTSVPAAGSTSSSRPGASARPGGRSAST